MNRVAEFDPNAFTLTNGHQNAHSRPSLSVERFLPHCDARVILHNEWRTGIFAAQERAIDLSRSEALRKKQSHAAPTTSLSPPVDFICCCRLAKSLALQPHLLLGGRVSPCKVTIQLAA